MSVARFELPARLEAREPPEARGLSRDGVRLMVASRGAGRSSTPASTSCQTSSRRRPARRQHLGDPSRRAARRRRRTELELHLRPRCPTTGEALGRRASPGETPRSEARAGDELELPPEAARDPRPLRGRRPAVARARRVPAPLEDYLARHGRPIRYRYVPAPWPLEAYQTVYALEPGSAEMPSAGRPFTPELITRLVASRRPRRTDDAPHRRLVARAARAAVPRALPRPEETARLVNAVHGWGGRVIAVGTTVVRALETSAAARRLRRGRRGLDRPGRHPRARAAGRRRSADRLARARGLPSPDARAVAGDELLERCYTPRSSTATSGTSSATAS